MVIFIFTSNIHRSVGNKKVRYRSFPTSLISQEFASFIMRNSGLPVSNEYKPGSDRSIDLGLHVVLQPFVLLRPLPEDMLCTHQHKVDWSILKSIPVVTSITIHYMPLISSSHISIYD